MRTKSRQSSGSDYENSSESDLNPHQQAIQAYMRQLLPAIILFLTDSHLGRRRLVWFCANILKSPITHNEFDRVISMGAENMGKQLEIWDSKAGPQAQVIECDTIHKGHKGIVFGAVVKGSRYLFELCHLKAESEAYLTPIFERLNACCFNLRVIITDLAKTFLAVVPRVFSSVIHLGCHIHALRLLYRTKIEAKKQRAKLMRKITEIQGTITTAEGWRDKNRQHQHYRKGAMKRLQEQKKRLCNQAGIPCYPNGTVIRRNQRLPPNVKVFSVKIDKAQVKYTRFCTQTQKQLVKITRNLEKLAQERGKYSTSHASVMRSSKKIHQFHALLNATDPKTFETTKRHLLALIQHNSDPLDKEIRSLLDDHPELWRHLPSSEVCGLGPREISTNTIESVFSRVRLLLDQLRYLPETPGLDQRLVLFRYWYNALGPLSGHNRGISPCMAMGIKLTPNEIITYATKGITL